MKKVSYIAILALAACASDGGGGRLGGEARQTGVGDPLSIVKTSGTAGGFALDGRMEEMFIVNPMEDESNGTDIAINFVKSKSGDTYMMLTTTDWYEDGSPFIRGRPINEKLFNRALNGRAIIADFKDVYTAYYYTGVGAQEAPVALPRPDLTPDPIKPVERRTDEFQVALGGGALGLQFADFGYWRALYYERIGNTNHLMSYDWQPIFGGNNNLLTTGGAGTIASAGRTTGDVFTGNAVALITYEKSYSDGSRDYYDTPVGGYATFTLGANPTLEVKFDNWYTMTFTDSTTGGIGVAGNASVVIDGVSGVDFATKYFKLGSKDIELTFKNTTGIDATLAYDFYGDTAAASEMVGGFSYWEGITSDPTGRLGVVGGFGAKFGLNQGRNDVTRPAADGSTTCPTCTSVRPDGTPGLTH